MTYADDRPAPGIPSTDLRGNREPAPDQTLRQRAEQIARDSPALSPAAIAELSAEDLQRTLHELRVRQIELELENAALRRACPEAKAAQTGDPDPDTDPDTDTDEQARVGRCEVSASGRIKEANPAASNLLGLAQDELIGQPLARFIAINDRDVFHLFCQSFLEAPLPSAADSGASGGPRGCTLRMQKSDGATAWAQLEAAAGMDTDGAPIRRVKLSDLTLSQRVEALQARLERAESIIADSLDWQSWFGLDGRYLWVNPAVEQLTGYTPEEILAMPDWPSVLIAEEDWPIFGETFQDAVGGSSGTGFKIRYVRKDGVKRWISVDWKPVIDAQGKRLGIRASGRDITDLKLTEAALRESEQRFRETFMSSPLCILIHDADTGEIVDANPAAAAMYGFDSVEALQADHLQLWLEPPPYSVDDALLWITKAVSEGPQRFEWRGRSVQGHLLWQLVYLRALVIEGKTRVLAMTVDTTREKQSNLDLQASEARVRAIIDASPVPFALHDGQQTITYLNSAFIKLFGYTLADIPTVADWWSLAYPDPDYRQKVMTSWTEGLACAQREGASLEPQEAMVRCKNGQVRTVRAGASVLPQAGEDLYLVNLYDVTDIRAAQAQAEQAARVKSEFLANMSHEIRTPLNAMLGLAQLLEGEALSAEQRHLVKQMRGAGNSLLALVNDILDLSKLVAGQLRLEVRTFSPAAVLAKVGSLLGQQARTKGLDFRLDTPADLAKWLRGDPLRLEQILVNLVGNAVKFTERGEVRIQLSQQDVDATAMRLRLEVRDTGIGIRPEHLATLGTAFNQGDGSITRRFGGTGLGLAISKQLVDRMGGSFGVDSRLGVGSTFWCELPFERANLKDRPQHKPAPAERPARARLRGLHCLVVDDSPLNQEVVERALRREGARATLVFDGQQALDHLRAQPRVIGAVLMDVQMPVMDGLTATRAIRRELGLTDLPVIAFSAGVLAEQRRQALGAGVSDFLAKPVDLEELVAVLQRWCTPPPPNASGPSRTEAPSAAEATRTHFPDVPGLDLPQAAQYLGNDWAAFQKLLPGLIGELRDVAQRARDDLARGAVTDAAGRFHYLQGNAWYVGAKALGEAAQTLERRLVQGDTEREDLMDAFEGQLDAVVTALTALLEQPTAAAADAVTAPRHPDTDHRQ